MIVRVRFHANVLQIVISAVYFRRLAVMTQFAGIRTVRREKYGRRGMPCARAPGVAWLGPNHALRCCKPIAPWYSSWAAQMTNMRKQPASRLEAFAILRIEHLQPCATCRHVFICSRYQSLQILLDISGIYRPRVYAGRILSQSGRGIIVYPGRY